VLGDPTEPDIFIDEAHGEVEDYYITDRICQKQEYAEEDGILREEGLLEEGMMEEGLVEGGRRVESGMDDGIVRPGRERVGESGLSESGSDGEEMATATAAEKASAEAAAAEDVGFAARGAEEIKIVPGVIVGEKIIGERPTIAKFFRNPESETIVGRETAFLPRDISSRSGGSSMESTPIASILSEMIRN
jgi:hypothetical protein